MAPSQVYTSPKGRDMGGGMASNQRGVDRSDGTLIAQNGRQLDKMVGAASTGSDGSASIASLTSSGHSLSQPGCSHANGHAATPSRRGQVDVQTPQAKQPPTTPQRARRMTADRSSIASSIASPSSFPMQTPLRGEGSVQKKANGELAQVPASKMQRRGSHASYTSDDWRSPRRPSFNSGNRLPPTFQPVESVRAVSMSGIPEYLAVQEMAFRQGQHDHHGSRSRIPPSPFSKHFDHVWAESYKLGVAYGKAPAASPAVASSPLHENYAWTVLINPATQDLEHPNGSFDMAWAREICIMSLNCMKELIRLVCRRLNDWRKIVCDIPLPVKHALAAFPDLCEYYAALQQDAHEALNGRLPAGY